MAPKKSNKRSNASQRKRAPPPPPPVGSSTAMKLLLTLVIIGAIVGFVFLLIWLLNDDSPSTIAPSVEPVISDEPATSIEPSIEPDSDGLNGWQIGLIVGGSLFVVIVGVLFVKSALPGRVYTYGAEKVAKYKKPKTAAQVQAAKDKKAARVQKRSAAAAKNAEKKTRDQDLKDRTAAKKAGDARLVSAGNLKPRSKLDKLLRRTPGKPTSKPGKRTSARQTADSQTPAEQQAISDKFENRGSGEGYSPAGGEDEGTMARN